MKLSKQATARHDECLSLLSLQRPLTFDEKTFVYRHYQPGATNNVGKAGIFFTPPAMADEFAIFAQGGSTYLDLCAGIGALSWAVLSYHWHEKQKPRFTCVEINPEFIEVGRRLLPEADWIRGDAFDRSFISSLGLFDVGIANPPFGNVPTKSQADWLTFRGPAHLMVAEILLRTCHGVEMIIPDSDHSYPHGRVPPSAVYKKWADAFDDAYFISPESLDLDPKNPDYAFHGANIRCAVVSVEAQDYCKRPLYGTLQPAKVTPPAAVAQGTLCFPVFA